MLPGYVLFLIIKYNKQKNKNNLPDLCKYTQKYHSINRNK